MAKAKPAKTSKSLPAATAKSKTPIVKTSAPSKVDKKSAEPAPAFTGIVIGHAAGDVWGCLSDGPKSLAEIKGAVKAPSDVVIAAVGWLAREDKLEFVTNGKTVKIGLR